MTPPQLPQGDILSSLNQKALLSLAADHDDPAMPRSYRLPSIEELSELFPDLEIEELLGTGGMGCVFKARQKKLDRVVALKILPRELARDDMFAERFSREARAMARLNHPNIVSIFDFGRAGDVYYLAMEYMDGMNLRELIDANALNPHEGYAVFASVCQALQYAHGEGVVHRDIKPENILFNKQGHVALADFGLARLAMDTNAEFSITQTRQAMGTLNYMAPEQYEDPKSVDHRADIYALGVLLYELITGKIPRGSFPASFLAGTDWAERRSRHQSCSAGLARRSVPVRRMRCWASTQRLSSGLAPQSGKMEPSRTSSTSAPLRFG